jgi:hypothetical protein
MRDTIGIAPEMGSGVMDEKAEGLRCEVKSLLLRQKKGEIEIIEKSNKQIDEDPYSKYALVSKQSFDETHKLISTTLEINSPQLLKVFKEVITYYPGESLDFKSKFTIEDPYMMLVHHRDALLQYRDETDDTIVKMHIALLLDHLTAEAGPRQEDINTMIKAGTITFPLLWVIFKPGDWVCQHSNGHTRLFQVRRHGYGESSARGKYFDLSCSFVSFDGEKVGRANDKLRIWDRGEFFGMFPTSITSLSAFPIKFLEATERVKILEATAERGERYLAIKEMCVMEYNGLYLYLRRPPWNYYSELANYDGTFLPETTTGRVVIDPKTFNEEARKQKESIADEEDKRKKRKDEKESKPCMFPSISIISVTNPKSALDDSDTSVGQSLDPRLCPSYVYGFSFEKKEWCKFFVDFLSPVEWKPDALNSLILPSPQKRLLKGLVSGHKFPERARDLPGQKGKGLVVLLHGAPGSGKTLTAGENSYSIVVAQKADDFAARNDGRAYP